MIVRAMGITQRQFTQIQQRLCGQRQASPAIPAAALVTPRTAQPRLILGIDPSLRGTGYGFIRLGKANPEATAQGVINCPAAWPRSRCLLKIAETMRDLAQAHRPDVCVVEGLFYAQNLQTALIMGEARGAAIAAVAGAGIEIYEVAPRKVKQAIVGYGAAQKLAVARMVQRMLKLAQIPQPDAADALALALTFAQEQGRYSLNAPRRI